MIVAGLGVEPSLQDYEPHVHRTLPRVDLLAFFIQSVPNGKQNFK